MAGELLFTTKVDLSGLNQGTEQMAAKVQEQTQKAAESVEQFTARARAAQDAYNANCERGIEVQKAMSAAFDQAAAAGATFVEAMEAANAAATSVAVAEEAVATSSRHVVSEMTAASGATRLLDGALPIRAVENFATKVLGLGPALQAAFPVVGALALGEVVVDMGEKLYDFGVKANTLANELGTDWLTGAIAQFDGLAAAVEDADKQIDGLSKDMDSLATKGKSAQVEYIRLTEGAAAADKAQADAKRQQISANETILAGLKLQSAELERQAQPTTYTNSRTGARGTYMSDEALAARKQLEAVEKQIADVQRTNNVLQQESINLDIKASQVKEGRTGGSRGANPDVQRLRDLEAVLLQEKTQHDVSASEEVAYWQKYLSTFAAGTSQYASVAEKYISAKRRVAEEGNQATREMIRAAQQEIRMQAEISERLQEAYQKNEEQEHKHAQSVIDISRATAQWHDAQNQANRDLQLTADGIAVSTGHMTAYAAAIDVAAIHAAAFQDRLAEIQAELAAIDADENLTDDERQKKRLPVLAQQAQVQGQAKNQAQIDQADINKQITQPFANAFGTINQDWLHLQGQLIFGTRNVGVAFANMGVSILESTAASFEKMLATALVNELKMTVAHQVAKTTQAATDVAAAATSDAVSQQSALKQVTHWATVAAAKAWAAFADIPIVGPVLGAAAAAVTFAGVEALAAFETGGIIPNTGVALVHQGEAVLPKPLTNFLMNAAGGNTNNSSASMTNNFYGGTSDAQFRRQMTRNASHVVRTVQRGLRDGGRG